ncbi:fimbria/pilus outer membrane usher protein [Escherichia coli]|nr:fimbria/pilus outer membrane usher protein [Escherichia coli]
MRRISFIFFIFISHGVYGENNNNFKFNYEMLNLNEDYLKYIVDNDLGLGNRIVNIYVNNELTDVSEVYFKKVNKTDIIPCITKDNLLKYGFSKEGLRLISLDNELCIKFNNNLVSYIFTPLNNTLLINIPTEFLSTNKNEIADEQLWDDGINAFILNYRMNYKHTNLNSSYYGFWEPRVNIGGWRFKNASYWNKTGGNFRTESMYTYAEHGINRLKSRLTIGDKYTNSNIFDSFTYRGIEFSKDENMVPHSAKIYSPVVRGIAKTNATVEIRQNGYLLYTTSVPPGDFNINTNEFSLIGSGLLDVTIIESSGQKQKYTVPYSVPMISIPKGYNKYNITIGKYRGNNISTHNKKTIITEGTYMHGLSYGYTIFGGIQFANNYNSYALGISKDAGEYGGVLLSWKTSNSMNYNDRGWVGEFMYNKNFYSTGSNITLSHAIYKSQYRTLNEIFDAYTFNESDKDYSTSIILSTPIMEGSGNLNYSKDKYINGDDRDLISLGYSNRIGMSTISINYLKTVSVSNGIRKKSHSDNVFNINLSIPFQPTINHDIYSSYQITSSDKNMLHDIGMTGSSFKRQLNWYVREQIQSGNKNKFSYAGASWNGTHGNISGNINHNNFSNEFNVDISGAILAHSSGITFGQRITDTAALIEAKGVNGAKIINYPWIKTDGRGYALSGTLTPYVNNIISIDPDSLPKNSSIKFTDINVVPTTGAIVKAKYKTSTGINSIIKITRENGRKVPFGAILLLTDTNGVVQSTSIIDDDGQAYITGLNTTSRIKLSWGKSANDNCQVEFNIKKSSLNNGLNFINGICK